MTLTANHKVKNSGPGTDHLITGRPGKQLSKIKNEDIKAVFFSTVLLSTRLSSVWFCFSPGSLLQKGQYGTDVKASVEAR